MAYIDTILTDSPASVYILNEITGTDAIDQKAVQNGVYAGGYTQAQSGLVLNENVYSTSFDGASGQVTVANNANQQPGTGSWSVECWVYPTALGGNQGVFIKDTSAGYSNQPWGFQFGNTTLSFLICTSANVTYTVNQSGAVSNNNVYHVVGYFDSVNQIISVTTNGVASTNTTSIGVGESIGSPTGTVRIGQQKNGTNRWFFGKVQYCAIYNKLLTSTQILDHYNAGIQANFTGSYLKA